MKKIITFLMIFVLALLSLSARPQFFFGTGAEWGRIYPDGETKTLLESNARYGGRIYYISFIVPEAEFTFLPYADFPLGITVCGGYGFVSGLHTGSTSYSYNPSSYADNFRYGADDVYSVTGGLRYTHLADSDKYFSFTFSALYSWERFTLNSVNPGKGKKVNDKDKMTFDLNSVSVGFGIMGRYDKSYFKVDCSLRKDIDLEKGISSLLEGEGYSVMLSATIGIVFTFLTSNQFMR